METSCGAVLFTHTEGGRRYVLVRRGEPAIYGLPKGHIEQGESEEQTALREIREETCISARILPGFRECVEYVMPNGMTKRVVYFIARYDGQTPAKNPDEMLDVEVLPYAEAVRLLTFDNVRGVLQKADGWLTAAYPAEE